MGKVKTRLLGLEEVEEKQKKEQKEKAKQKKAAAKKEAVIEEPKKEEDQEKEKTAKKAKAVEKKIEVKKNVARARGAKYQKALKGLDRTKKYSITEAVSILKKIKYTKMDESVELHLNVDKTGLKGEVDLPYSTGKTVRVRIVDDKTLSELEKGQFNFDILVTHPSFMPKLARFAKVLGPKGLMPNPKAGTISPKPEEIAKKFEKGMLRWKTEPKFPLIHQLIGKVSAEDKNLVENANKFLQSVGRAHVLSAYIKTTMSPSLKIDLEKSW